MELCGAEDWSKTASVCDCMCAPCVSLGVSLQYLHNIFSPDCRSSHPFGLFLSLLLSLPFLSLSLSACLLPVWALLAVVRVLAVVNFRKCTRSLLGSEVSAFGPAVFFFFFCNFYRLLTGSRTPLCTIHSALSSVVMLVPRLIHTLAGWADMYLKEWLAADGCGTLILCCFTLEVMYGYVCQPWLNLCTHTASHPQTKLCAALSKCFYS